MRDPVPAPHDPNEPDDAVERDEPEAARGLGTRLVVAGLLALFGFALVTQVNAEAEGDRYAGFREQDLVDVLTGLTGTAERAESEIERLEAAREELLDDNRGRSTALSEARSRAESLAVLAGTVPVTGPGVRITITEEDGSIAVGSLLDTVQELRTSLAEAIEMNDQVRLVASSAIGTAEGGIVVDGVRLTSPYVIEAIGEPATLEGGLTFTGGPVDTLEDEGARVEVELLDRVDITSVRSGEGAAGAGVDRGPEAQ